MTYPQELLKNGRKANPYFCLMGIDPVSFGDGKAVLSMDIRPDMLNGAGWLQGGIYASIADEAMALSVCTLIRPEEGIATISETTNYFKGLQKGTLIADAWVVRRGRRVIFAEGVCYQKGDESNILSKTSASFAVV